MKITVLLENTGCSEDFACEHGLSLYIETNGKKILFDAGQTPAFADNAKKLGIDLSNVDFCVLSHGHYDHGGGLKTFLDINKKAPVYVSPYAFGQHCHGEKYIGLDQSLPRERFVSVTDPMEIAPGIRIDPKADRTENAGSQGLTLLEGGILVPETFRHEQYLLVTEGERRYLFSGCSHRGAVNIAAWFHPDVFIGGFHLSKEEKPAVLAVAEELQKFDTAYYTGHCTGQAQFSWMKPILDSRLHGLSTGMRMEL